MKKQITFIVILALVAFLVWNKFDSSKAQDQGNKNEGKIGDVKYSVLDPDKFRELNGKGWVLMDGSSMENSGLAAITKEKTMPDARGVFIRGMNLGQTVENGDVDGNRAVGKFQLDSFQGHKHYNQQMIQTGSRDIPNTTDQRRRVEAGAVETAGVHDGGFGVPRISKETRPRNITLYTYIKINNE